MSEHTKTPWTYAPNTMYVLGHPDGLPNPVASPLGRTVEQCQANAAFIVRACNSHQAMRDALGKALVCLKPQGRPEREGDQYYEVICEIRDVLAGAA